MRIIPPRFVRLLTCLACLTTLDAQNVKTPASGIDLWLQQLSDQQFSVREKATMELWKRGLEAQPKLRLAAQSDEPETALRAADLLRKIDLQLTPESDPEIIDFCVRYPKASVTEKSRILRVLQQKRAWWQLLKLCAAESDEKLVKQYALPMERVALFAAREQLLKNRVDEAFKVLQIAPISSSSQLFLAELHRTQGTLAAELARAKDEPGVKGASWRLALHRANGDFKAARKEAMNAGDTEMAAAMAVLCGDPLPWLREVALQVGSPHQSGGPARSVYARLASRNWKGDLPGPDDLKSLLPRKQEQHHFDMSYSHTMALLMLGRHEAAESIMIKEDYFGVVRQMLSLERIDEIWKLLGVDPKSPCSAEWVSKRMLEHDEDKGDPFDDADSREIQELISMAATLENRGMLELIRASYVPPAMLLAQKRPEAFLSMLSTLFTGDQTRMPCFQTATEIGATWAGDDPKRWDTLFSALFSENEFAQDWWGEMARLEPKATPRERLDGLLALMRIGTDPRNLRGLWMQRAWKFCQTAEGQLRDAYLERLANLTLMTGDADLALKVWKEMPESMSENYIWRQRVMLLTAVNRWPEVIEILNQQLEDSQNEEGGLVSAAFHAYIAAALRRNGKESKAQEHDRLAEKLSLGDATASQQIADAYAFGDDFARAKTWRLRALSQLPPKSSRYGALAAEVCDELLLSPDHWQLAAALAEVSAAEAVSDEYYRFELGSGKMQLRLKADACRALASIKAGGDRQAAIAVLERCHKRFITDGELADFFFPALLKAGLRKEHDAWFEETWSCFQNQLARYPQSWNTHNTAAWLAARAALRLDEAQKSMQLVLEQFPLHPAYLDTMGEIEFARGNRRIAMEWSLKSIAQAPDEVDLRRQHDHFKRDPLPR